MTLQEKIDKLPLSIIFVQRLYALNIVQRSDIVRIIYRCNQPIVRNVIMDITNYNSRKTLSQRLEDVVDRALTIIKNGSNYNILRLLAYSLYHIFIIVLVMCKEI